MQIIQTALAACVAWFLAVLILGAEQPTFALIAAVIALGLALGERGRRAVELTLAVAFGVALADLLLSVLGVGAVQAEFFVALAMAVAVFLRGGNLGVKEAAISAMIMMFIFQPSDAGLPIERFLEALIGGGTALLINALIPVNPERMVEDAAFPVFAESATVLEEVADALEDGDARRVQRAYVKAREIDARVSGLKEAAAAGRETARLAPPRRKSLGHMDLYARAADQIDLTVRDVRALARAALSVVQPGDAAPEPLPASIRGLARATESLAAYLQTSGDPPEETRQLALGAATEASTLLEEDEDLARSLGVNALVDQIHSSAVDLIGGTGLDRAAALQALQEASASAGADLVRERLSAEAIRLARTLAQLMPDEPEALGLLALMLLHDARRSARVDREGDLVPLEEQDRSLWDREAISEGVGLLEAALRLGRPGPYQVQAAIAACHDTAAEASATDWAQIAALYGELARLVPSPVANLNRA